MAAVARLLRRFPSAAPLLADGRLNSSTFEALKDVLTLENCDHVLSLAANRSEAEVDRIVATLKPRPVVRDTVRVVTPTLGAVEASLPLVPASSVAPPIPVSPRPSSPRVTAVDEHFVTFSFKVSNEFMADLAQVSAALSHVVTDGNKEAVLRECMQRTLASIARTRGGLPARRPYAEVSSAADRSAPAPACASSPAATPNLGALPPDDDAPDDVPLSLAREVWLRDEACCTFVAHNGRRCSSVWQLEIHHRFAKGFGGKSSLGNLTLHCRVHNLLCARRDFGEQNMLQFSRSRS